MWRLRVSQILHLTASSEMDGELHYQACVRPTCQPPFRLSVYLSWLPPDRIFVTVTRASSSQNSSPLGFVRRGFAVSLSVMTPSRSHLCGGVGPIETSLGLESVVSKQQTARSLVGVGANPTRAIRMTIWSVLLPSSLKFLDHHWLQMLSRSFEFRGVGLRRKSRVLQSGFGPKA